MQVSLFASAVRPQIWGSLFTSLKGTTVDYEIVFAGNANPIDGFPNIKEVYPQWDFYKADKLRYIKTEDIKPAQCYEIARRNCKGEVVVWIADDCEFPNDVIGKAYRYWKSQENEKLILSIQTRETGYNLPEGKLFDMNIHRFFAGITETPLMCPLGMMSRKFLDELGGLDSRYVCGQYENDIVMRALEAGAKTEIFGDAQTFIDIDHLGKSIAIGESKDEPDFLNRPFATSYGTDRRILETSWYFFVKDLKMQYKRLSKFQPYKDENLLTKSQGFKGKWQ